MPVRMTLLLATILSSSALLPPAAPVEPNSPVRSMLVFMSWNTFSMMSTSLLADMKGASAYTVQEAFSMLPAITALPPAYAKINLCFWAPGLLPEGLSMIKSCRWR